MLSYVIFKHFFMLLANILSLQFFEFCIKKSMNKLYTNQKVFF